MGKEYPYFKFFVNEWISGDISFLEYDEQGLFINLCCYYWSRNGNLSLANAKRKFSEIKPTAFDSLINNRIIKVENDMIIISFLNEQMNERGIVSKQNSKNGKLGGRPKAAPLLEKKPTAFFSETETITKKSNKDKIREDKIREKDNTSFDFSFVAPEFIKPYFEWLEYLKQNKRALIHQIELEKTYSMLLMESKNNAFYAQVIIDKAISSQWKNFFALKENEIESINSPQSNKKMPCR